jgi:hypothetical protein
MKRFQGTVSEEKEPQSLVKRFVVVSCAVEQVWKRLNEYDRVQSTLHVFPVRARTRVSLYIYTYPEWDGFPAADEKTSRRADFFSETLDKDAIIWYYKNKTSNKTKGE